MTNQKPLSVLIQEMKERQEKAREYWVTEKCSRGNYFHVTDFESPDSIYCREQPEPKDFDRVIRALEVANAALGKCPGKGTTICIEARDEIRAILAGEEGE